MKLLMEPGRALLVLAVVAFVAQFVVDGIPVIGGLLNVILWFAVIFGVIGGMFLTVMSRTRPA